MDKHTNFMLLEQLAPLMPGIVAWKNKEGKYLGCNENMAAILNLTSSKDIVGRTLYEIMPKKYADPLLQNDQEVISNNKEKIIEELSFDIYDNDGLYISRKVPLRNDSGDVIGLLAIAVSVNDQKNLEQFQVLGALQSQTLTTQYERIYFTKREAECVNYLAKGKSAKQIGKLLNLSPRTIEFYLEKAKRKLDCHTQTELIAKVIEHQYSHKLPALS